MATVALGGAPPELVQQFVPQGTPGVIETGGNPMPPPIQPGTGPQLNLQPVAQNLPTPPMPQQSFQVPAQQYQQPAPQQQFAPQPQQNQQFQNQQPQRWQPPAVAPMPSVMPPDPMFANQQPSAPTAYPPLPGELPFQSQQQPFQTQPAPQQFQGQPQQQQPRSTQFRDYLTNLGVAGAATFQDDESLLDTMATAYTGIQQAQQMARFGQQPQLQPSDLNDSSKTPAQAPAQAAPQAQPPAQAKAPEWKPEWEKYVRFDQQAGRYVPIDGYINPVIAERANEFADFKRNQLQALSLNPLEFLEKNGLNDKHKSLKDELRNELVAELDRRQQEFVDRQNAESFHSRVEQVAYMRDKNGDPILNPVDGVTPVLTPVGQAVLQQVANYRQQFIAHYGREPVVADVIRQGEAVLAQFGIGQHPPQQQQQVAGQVPQFVQQQPPGYVQQPGQQQFTQQAQQPVASPYGMQPQQVYQQQQVPTQVVNQQLLQNTVQRAVAAAQQYPGAAGTVASAAQQAALPQDSTTDLRSLLMQAAANRGIDTSQFTI